MRKLNQLKRRLKQGETVLGTWCVIPSATVINIIAAAGFDFVIIDMEHGPMTFETAEDMVRAADSEGCTPIIRVPSREEASILRALDIGAHGIIVPHIESVEEARQALSYCKYYPEGMRGFSPYTRAGGYASAENHCARENEETMLILILEGMGGMMSHAKIVEEGLADVLYVGTYDLSQTQGIAGDTSNPRVKSYVESCAQKARESGVATGCLAHSPEEINWFLNIGLQFITYRVDSNILFKAVNDIKCQFELQKDLRV